MKVLVTGANGHIGSHVVRACLDAGQEVAAFVRPGSDRRALAGLDVEVRLGDLRDAASVAEAVRGVDTVHHVGAVHRNWVGDEAELLEPAVQGTRHVLEAAARAGVRRVVVTSSGATVGFAADPARPLREDAPPVQARGVYSRSKIAAEQLALAAAAAGQDVVVTNPSGVFGPRDYRLTPATRGLVGLLQGDPAFFALCLTDVRDVARGHVLAAAHAKAGQRYLLTGELCTPAQLRALLERVTGIRPSGMSPPKFLLRWLAGLQERKARASGQDAGLTRDMVEDFFGHHLAYDSARSRDELGLRYRPAEEVLRDAVRWLLFVEALAPKVAARVRARLGAAAAPDSDWQR